MKKKTIYITFFIKKGRGIDNKLAFLYFCFPEISFMAYF